MKRTKMCHKCLPITFILGCGAGVSSMTGSASAPRPPVPPGLPPPRSLLSHVLPSLSPCSPCTSVEAEVDPRQPLLQPEQCQLLQAGPLQLRQALQGHGLHPRAGAWHRGRAKVPLENTPVWKEHMAVIPALGEKLLKAPQGVFAGDICPCVTSPRSQWGCRCPNRIISL